MTWSSASRCVRFDSQNFIPQLPLVKVFAVVQCAVHADASTCSSGPALTGATLCWPVVCLLAVPDNMRVFVLATLSCC